MAMDMHAAGWIAKVLALGGVRCSRSPVPAVRPAPAVRHCLLLDKDWHLLLKNAKKGFLKQLVWRPASHWSFQIGVVWYNTLLVSRQFNILAEEVPRHSRK